MMTTRKDVAGYIPINRRFEILAFGDNDVMRTLIHEFGHYQIFRERSRQ